MKNKILLTLSSLAILLGGCNYLDTMPGDTMTGEQFWATADGLALTQYCNTYYSKLIVGHGDPNGWDSGAMFKAEYQSDNLYSSGQSAITYGQNRLNTSDGQWEWSIVRGCNEFIDNYMRTPAPLEDKKKAVGEVYFFKAYDYFNKVKRFGDVPWYDHALGKKDPDLFKGRDSRILVMQKIVETIDKAIENLPQKTKVNRVSKDAAICLKARICLFEGTYRKYRGIEGADEYLKLAYDAAGELMQPKYGYSLYNVGGEDFAYYNLFIQANYQDNPEIILSREYEPGINMGNDVSFQMVNTSDGMSRDCFEEYLCSKTGKPVSICGCHHPEDGMLKEMENRDKRLMQTVCVPKQGNPHSHYLFRTVEGVEKGGAPNIFGLFESKNGKVFYGNSSTGYAICKYYNDEDYLKQKHHMGTVDAPVMRYAEVLLIRAEAGAELGLDPQLDLTVNALRKRVGFPYNLDMNPVEDPDLVAKYPDIKGANANLIREIRRERRIELFCEGFRWDDIVRWKVGDSIFNRRERRGMKIDNTLYTEEQIKLLDEKIGISKDGYLLPYKVRGTLTQNFTDKNYLYNIPINEISLNPNLLPQNPGWEE